MPAAYTFASNTYVICSDSECAVVDPSVPYHNFSVELPVKYILLTHAHFDHMMFIDEWVSNTGAEVIVSENDAPALSDCVKNCYQLFLGKNEGYFGKYRVVKNEDRLMIGDDIIYVISTPGHTPGSLMYYGGSNLLAGDTIFAGGGYGRCDLPGGNIDLLKESIAKVIALPDETLIFPGHGPTTTIFEFRKNYMLK